MYYNSFDAVCDAAPHGPGSKDYLEVVTDC